MKDKLQKWVREKGETLQEISQDISWYGKKLQNKAKKAAQELLPVPFHPRTPPVKETEKEDGPEAFFPAADPREEERALREKLNWAIHKAYYKEGGFRYFGCNLLRYVNVVLPSETRPEDMWAAGYNSCIQPMLRQLEKLEKELASLVSQSGTRMPAVEKAGLLEKMRTFQRMARTLGLDRETGWEADDYRQALRHYAGELNGQLLESFRLPEDD